MSIRSREEETMVVDVAMRDGGDVREYMRPVRNCVVNPQSTPLTEESLPHLEHSHPNYRLSQRNLNHWFFYLESTFATALDDFAGWPDQDFYPSCLQARLSEAPLSS